MAAGEAESSGDSRVAAQYEAYPYPARDPKDEAKRLIEGSPSHLDEVNHCLFAGRRDWSRPFRALAAGGGTGDGAIMLAQQMAARGFPGDVIHLDLSEAAQAIARARAEARGLANIRFVRGDLSDLASLDLGAFDYIDCCGVLHHLADPPAALKALAGLLGPEGGIGLMVYGAYGRTGLYPLQDLLRDLAGREALPEQVALAKRLLPALPRTNWFRRNPFLGDHKRSDAELVDLLLHGRDRAYDLPELFDLIDGAGLAVAAFVEPLRYDPLRLVSDPAVKRRLTALPWRRRAIAAEVLAGNMKKHSLYLTRAGRGAKGGEGPEAACLARPAPEAVPLLTRHQGPELARALQRELTLKVELDGLPYALPLPPLAPAILSEIDGRKSLAEIEAALRQRNASLAPESFAQAFAALYEALNGINALFLTFPHAPETGAATP